ncbi:hypothetical protein CFO_g3421 [Ceratocystis platani]|uniref:Transport and Golgi organization protein 2 n=1 Tax=Ceratocystis fimbriata f. sp. platani TaxID=88771 RepID=A0A0F8CU47_CERFI|nr:hypothetical protein CFO_g3421 [Ceratocystis platani]
MCIALITTSHPDYAIVIADNRDEFILRPTSRPEWWKHAAGHEILSSRDLQRAEKGTWLGISREGSLAVLTNYRETGPDDKEHPICAKRSRGGMVTAWLGSRSHESMADAVHNLLAEGVRGVGGFSMVCGKLRKTGERQLQPLGIVSNRCDHIDHVEWIGDKRDQVYGLSNTVYGDPDSWRKIDDGMKMIDQAAKDAYAKKLTEDQFCDALFGILDTNTFPDMSGASMEETIAYMRESIFIPPVGDKKHREAMEARRALGKGKWTNESETSVVETSPSPERGRLVAGFDTGMYGTQRQTLILVDWEGNVTFKERALWDANGNPLVRGEADVVHKFKIEGWD